MPDPNFKPVDGDVFLRLLEDHEMGEDHNEYGVDDDGSALIPAIIVDAGPDAAAGIKKGATCMVYSYVRHNAKLTEDLIVASSWSVAAIVSG